jgi:hypothetical protein
VPAPGRGRAWNDGVVNDVEQFRVTYTGTAPYVGAFAQALREKGCAVSYAPPPEQRSVVVELVVIPLAVAGTYDVIKAVVGRFLERFPRAEVTIERVERTMIEPDRTTVERTERITYRDDGT